MNQAAKTPKLQLRKDVRRPRVLGGHPWVYANELTETLPEAHSGLACPLYDARGNCLGSGVYNAKSQIPWRRFSRAHGIAFDEEYLRQALTDAIDRRAPGTVRRLVWSDADYLPGLIVDQFEDVLVVQIVTLAVERQREAIAEILQMLLEPREILYRNDAPVRKFEGLDQSVFTQSGNALPERVYEIDELSYQLDLANAQKTGFYLDQREQHLLLASLTEGRRVLDGFCNQGAFALQAMAHGAEAAVAVDSSSVCCAAVKDNAKRNELEVEVVEANMFDYMKALKPDTFDCIVLDPPSFARNKKASAGALRGYKELNLRAFQNLPTGGILATYSCSQHIDAAIFEQTVAAAAGDAGREVRVFARTSQPFDHPILLNFPESAYLKGLILQVE